MAWFQPRILPSSVANRKSAGADAVPAPTAKLEPLFATAPVGAFSTLTTSGEPDGAKAAPSAVYTVARLVPLSATHQGESVSDARPQALTRFGSTWSAIPASSETRLCVM